MERFRRYFRRIIASARKWSRARKLWHMPRPVKLVVLDGLNHEFLIPLFGSHRYEIIDVSGDTLYVNPRILFRALRHVIATRKPMVGYALAVLERMQPAIVVTFIDNSGVFQHVGQRYRAARFLAVQNGRRFLDRDYPPGSPTIHHREFACIGRFDVDQFTRHGARVERYYPIGYIRDAYYRAYRRDRGQAAAVRKEFDLCLVAQFRPGMRRHAERLTGFEVLTRHLGRFAESHKARLCVALRKHPDSDPVMHAWEREWFAARLGDGATMFPNVPGAYTTHTLMERSRVSLGAHTTALLEAFVRGNRILSCNFTGNPVYDFAVAGPWALSDSTYEVFEERLLWLLSATDEDYATARGDVPSYLSGYDEHMPPDVFLRQLITDAVQGAAGPATWPQPAPALASFTHDSPRSAKATTRVR